MIDVCPFRTPDKISVQNIAGLMYFIWQRETIRLAREKGQTAPWTEDPILAKYKFTNIRRKDDRVSLWIIKNIITSNLQEKDLWFILLIARIINWPPTLQYLIDESLLFQSPDKFDPEKFSEALENFKDKGNKVYSGAYIVYPTKMDPGGVKSLAIAKHIILPASKLNENMLEILKSNSIEKFVTELSKSFGISTFMAGQVAADLTYAPGHLDKAIDLTTYAPIGPGSSRGLNYLLKLTSNATWKQNEFNIILVLLSRSIEKYLNITDLTLHDVQNIMCEYSKYCRTVLEDGKPKTTYQPETEF